VTTPPPATSSQHPLAALEDRSFRLYWIGSLVSVSGTQMQQAAVAWQVYLLTHSAVALGLIGLFRVLPIVIFSLWGGVVADAINRRRLLLATESTLLVISAALAVLTLAGLASLWVIYLLTALGAGAYAFDSPARQAIIPSLVPRERLTGALSLMSTGFEVATVLGPSLAGVVIATRSVGTVYVIDAVSYLAALTALVLISIPPVAGKLQEMSIRAAIEGLRFVFHTPIMLSTLSLDFVATFFSSATALLPIFAHDILHVGSQGYGLLYADPSLGAIAAGIGLSIIGGRIRAHGRTILIAVAVYGLCTVLFGLSRVFLLSMVALAGVGAADAVSTILRQTVRQTVTPDALRGRMTSVNMVFFMGGPQFGEVEAGLVARAFGAPISVVSGGLAALIAIALIAALSSHLRHYRL
jgi:MFS family permease